MARKRVYFVTLDAALDERIESVRNARAAGRHLPPAAAILRAAIEAGLPALEPAETRARCEAEGAGQR